MAQHPIAKHRLEALVDGVSAGSISILGRGGTGRLLYGRHQLSEVSSPSLLQYGALDDRFPDYSTADQFLSETEFDQLVMLGEHVGDRIVRLFEAGTP